MLMLQVVLEEARGRKVGPAVPMLRCAAPCSSHSQIQLLHARESSPGLLVLCSQWLDAPCL